MATSSRCASMRSTAIFPGSPSLRRSRRGLPLRTWHPDGGRDRVLAVDLKLPTATNTVDKPETQEQTVVAVTADGRLHLNSREVAEDDLPTRLTEVLESKKERIVLIRADEDAAYGRVMAAMDAIRKA